MDGASTKTLLRAIATMRPPLAKLKGQGKPYDNLIDAILVFPDHNSSEPNPTGQQLQKELVINSTTLKKWVTELYDDLIALIETKAIVFSKRQVQISAHGSRGYAGFSAELPSLPRIGEQLDFYFLTPIIGHGTLTVEDIGYYYTNDEEIVTVSLTSLTPYEMQLKQRAMFEKRLTIHDLIDLSVDDIAKLLYEWYGNTH